tara:strand:+ start:361 stop:468 length:108 start_codon:yes stop_codon:yes gene_type:complete
MKRLISHQRFAGEVPKEEIAESCWCINLWEFGDDL